MKRKLLSLLILLVASALFATSVFADGDPNIEGGGGGWGEGSEGNVWPSDATGRSLESLRITAVDKASHSQVGTTFDWINESALEYINKVGDIFWWGGNKLEYRAGGYSALGNVKNISYHGIETGNPVPPIITGHGGNIEAIKAYFSESALYLEKISQHTGVDADKLKSGDYILLIEPVAIYLYGGNFYATTATEAALLDEQTRAEKAATALHEKIGVLTQKNLPLSMFLKSDQLGFFKYDKPTTESAPNHLIKEKLGMGFINFNELGMGVSEEAELRYPVNTEVFTSVKVSSTDDIIIDDDASITFTGLPDGDVEKPFVVKGGESQLVWVRWTTPDTPTSFSLDITTSDGVLDVSKYNIIIEERPEVTPPNPSGLDRNDSFHLQATPTRNSETTHSWSEWYCWMVIEQETRYYEEEVYDENGQPVLDEDGEIVTEEVEDVVDIEVWYFDTNEFTVSIDSVEGALSPSEQNPTSTPYSFGSGYGVQINVDVEVIGDDSGTFTGAQSVIAEFPEFGFDIYHRRLESSSSGGEHSNWYFQDNEYSNEGAPVHFTPVWYPDGENYPVLVQVGNVWTPLGELSEYIVLDGYDIEGSVFDDWYVKGSKH